MQQISKNIVKSALLFGGTLGAASAANAGLTVTGANIYLDVAGTQFMTSDVATAMAGGMAYDAISGGSLTLSAFTSSGFSLTANSAGGAGIWSVFAAQYAFTADSLTTVSLSGNTAADSAVIWLYDNTTSSTLFLRGDGGPGEAWTSGNIDLAAGHTFTLSVNPSYANGGTETGTVLDFAVTAMPAPGAAALLGLAGLIARRRRA